MHLEQMKSLINAPPIVPQRKLGHVKKSVGIVSKLARRHPKHLKSTSTVRDIEGHRGPRYCGHLPSWLLLSFVGVLRRASGSVGTICV